MVTGSGTAARLLNHLKDNLRKVQLITIFKKGECFKKNLYKLYRAACRIYFLIKKIKIRPLGDKTGLQKKLGWEKQRC
jgi:hypothetical protein